MTQAFNLAQLANNLNTSGQLDATDGLSGVLPVSNGGTGQSSLTANNVLIGNGTSGITSVAPGTSGNVLTSNGTSWTSAAAGGIGVGQTWQAVTGSRAFGTTYTNSTGKPIEVLVSAQSNASGGGSASMTATVSGVAINTVQIEYYWSSVVVAFRNGLSFIVPNGATYSVSVSHSSALQSWNELR